jgi:hypothetical protein
MGVKGPVFNPTGQQPTSTGPSSKPYQSLFNPGPATRTTTITGGRNLVPSGVAPPAGSWSAPPPNGTSTPAASGGVKSFLGSNQGMNLLATGAGVLGSVLNAKAAGDQQQLSREQAILNAQLGIDSERAGAAQWQQQQDASRAQTGLEATQLDPLAQQKSLYETAIMRALAQNGPMSVSQSSRGQVQNVPQLGGVASQFLGDPQLMNAISNFEAARAQANPDGTPANIGGMGFGAEAATPYQATVTAAQQAAAAKLAGREASQQSALDSALGRIDEYKTASQGGSSGSSGGGGGKRGFLGKLLGAAAPFLGMIPGVGVPLAIGAGAAGAALQGGSAGDAALSGAVSGGSSYLTNRARK